MPFLYLYIHAFINIRNFNELYILAQSIGLVLFEKEPINEIFKRNMSNNKTENDGQLSLWQDFSGQ